MTESNRIAIQFKGTFSGRAWHGDNLMKILDGVSPEQAAERVIPAGHSIWALVSHMRAWQDAALRMLDGELITDLPDALVLENSQPSELICPNALQWDSGH